ncbi:hypothetical protein [Streptomyces sp. H34-S4]|uniref:hypothetical protein n=1 Tax=Streptomyces sp. H34-S4 TaxID=2996463 RepID=UPI002270E867|nr:hypothetical protein [Streptomyces sp. H34-S4]MCY0933038.1 hypothetical protein [Streptomyces sp. H34-S4]
MTRDSGNKMVGWNLGGEAVSTDLVESHQVHLAVLVEALEKSPYAQLVSQYEKFSEGLDGVHRGALSSSSSKEEMDRLPALLDSFLSAFRAFVDHTCKWLSSRYGNVVLGEFNSNLSREYDSEFAYRFMYKLRNYSQHCGMPPVSGHVRRWVDPDGEKRQEVSVTFDAMELLSKYDGWGQPVKSELQRLGGQFSVAEMATRLMASCSAVQAELLCAIAPRLQESADFLTQCDQSPEGADFVPALFGINPDEWRDPQASRDIQFRFIRPELAHLLALSLREAERILSFSRAPGDAT